MPDLSPAELLTAAADRLESLLALATPGPWTCSGPDSLAPWTVYDRQWSVASATKYDHDKPMSNDPAATGPAYVNADANAAYIAAVSPTVGWALHAAVRSWARAAADEAAHGTNVAVVFAEELDVARAILAGGEPDA